MVQVKTDPRVVRTRKLIMDSFIKLSESKEFRDITVKDITTEAMINRATFYYHFEDIYDLLEKALSEVLLINLNSAEYEHKKLDEDVFNHLFKAVTNFQQSLSNRCHRGYEDTIAQIIRDQLEVVFNKMLKAQYGPEKEETLKTTAVMLSWGLYGASLEWKRNGTVAPEEFLKTAMPFLLHGLQFDLQK